jgi:hypothetical protein
LRRSPGSTSSTSSQWPTPPPARARDCSREPCAPAGHASPPAGTDRAAGRGTRLPGASPTRSALPGLDGKLAEPRRRLGGRGTPRFAVLATMPRPGAPGASHRTRPKLEPTAAPIAANRPGPIWSRCNVHVWRNLLKQAGFTLEDIPKQWEAFLVVLVRSGPAGGAARDRPRRHLGYPSAHLGQAERHRQPVRASMQPTRPNCVTREGKLIIDDPQITQADQGPGQLHRELP